MPFENILWNQEYPKWYQIEKETEKTIQKLSTTKELIFYLQNSDEYVRRLALLRIYQLKLKDSLGILGEILEDPTESILNKNLAAFTIQSISSKWDMDLFISNRLLNQYTGNEKYQDIFRVEVNNALPSLKFDFSTSLLGSDLKVENENARQVDTITFDMPFSLKEWFSIWSEDFKCYAKALLVNLPPILWKAAKKVLHQLYLFFFKKAPSFCLSMLSRITRSIKNKKKAKDHTESYYRLSPSEKFNLASWTKNSIIQFLSIIFSPLRLILRHKKFSAAVSVIIYSALTFTTYGRVITLKYFDLDLFETHKVVYASSKEILSYAFDEFKEITGAAQSFNAHSGDEIVQATHKPAPSTHVAIQYKVVAKTGLNVRKEPNVSSEIIIDQMLAYNTLVNFLSQTETDAQGREWYLIETPEGNVGWAYSKWLVETGGN